MEEERFSEELKLHYAYTILQNWELLLVATDIQWRPKV